MKAPSALTAVACPPVSSTASMPFPGNSSRYDSDLWARAVESLRAHLHRHVLNHGYDRIIIIYL
jgi:hypothetical protein